MRHRWIKLRQQALRMARGRMVRHLADLYLQRGQVSLAEEVLEQHIIRFPTDQDALCSATIASAGLASRQENTLDLVKTHRQMLHDLLMLASTVLVLSPYARWPISEGERPSLTLVNTAIDELERITESFWRLCANTSLDLLGNLVEHFRTIIQLLKQVQARDAVQRCCSLAGEIAQILGKTLFDLHEYALAWSYYTFSLKAAQAAVNQDLWAVGLGRMSLLLIYWNQPHEALPLFPEPQQLTVQSPRIACWLAPVKAQVFAHPPDSDSFAPPPHNTTPP